MFSMRRSVFRIPSGRASESVRLEGTDADSDAKPGEASAPVRDFPGAVDQPASSAMHTRLRAGGKQCVLATSEIVKGPRSYYFSGRPGVRYDFVYPKAGANSSATGAKSGPSVQPQGYNTYFEIGYEAGPQVNGTEGFGFTINNKPTAAPCGIYSDIASCVFNTLQQIGPKTPGLGVQTISGRGHMQDGFYLNFRFDMPVPFIPNVEFVVENKGDFLIDHHNRDSEVDPFISNDLKSSLLVPIRGKLTIAPTFELQLFENKLAYNVYRSVSTSLSLNYSFDWRTGLKWRDVREFNNPTPLLPNLPSR